MARKSEDLSKFFNTPVGHIRDRIIIHENPKIPKEGIFLSLNGFPFLAKAGVEIDIPRAVRLMLDTRVETETTYDKDGNSYSRNIPRFTYTVIKEGINVDESGAVVDVREDNANQKQVTDAVNG